MNISNDEYVSELKWMVDSNSIMRLFLKNIYDAENRNHKENGRFLLNASVTNLWIAKTEHF